MPRFGNCSVCKALHTAPFGTRCRYMLEAKKYCISNNIPETDYFKYIDFDSMPKSSESDEIIQEVLDEKYEALETASGSSIPEGQVQELVRMNREQQDQIRALISRMENFTAMVENTGIPVEPVPTAAGYRTSRVGGQTGIKTPATAEGPPSLMATGGAAGHSLSGHQLSARPKGSDTRQPTPTRASSPAPSDFVHGPLTHALDKLSLAIDPAIDLTTQGITLRPEYYVQYLDKHVALKSIDHTKLSFNALVYGMCRIAKHLYCKWALYNDMTWMWSPRCTLTLILHMFQARKACDGLSSSLHMLSIH